MTQKERIIAQAMRMFVSQGIKSVRMDDIAQQLGVSKRTLYELFGDKESLLYREIFEKYYYDQARTIVSFWMPNKAWPNCNVNDPSARVLANYGASGV